ncbi:MAG: sigma-70 family RNA polymerase sigma factor [Planctomycetota bacterium]|nr:sigma-70 family RNA polymerase sigma factor [Planctomycetota bacterium]
MAKTVLTHARLDECLDAASAAPESFADLVEAALVEAKGRDLEIADPMSWHKEVSVGRRASGSFLNQFRQDVDSIVPLDRGAESLLARRIEFARTRLERAAGAAGLGHEQVEAGIAHPGTGWSPRTVDSVIAASTLPRPVARRWVELHALRAELVERNLFLVLINVERYAHTGASRVDLIQEGCIALFRAVDGFDWRRGLLFRTYAVHWLNQAFRNHLYNFGHTVRVPIYLQKAMKQVQEARIRLGDPKATSGEIATEGELDEHLVSNAVRASRVSFSLDAELGGSGMNRLGDYLEDEGEDEEELEQLDRLALERDVVEALAQLKTRERYVIRLRFGIGVDREHTLAEVARNLGLSVERVRQIQMSALGRLSTPGLRSQFAAYLN